MHVYEAALFWPFLESINIPLASPALAEDSGPWLEKWIVQAKNNSLRIDYIAVHWYGWPSANAFKVTMQTLYELHGGSSPLLITEFGPADWSAKTVETNRFTRKQVLVFMKEVLPWLEEQTWVAGYAWFNAKSTWPPGTCSALFEDNGITPTELGLYYASITNEIPAGDQSIEILS